MISKKRLRDIRDVAILSGILLSLLYSVFLSTVNYLEPTEVGVELNVATGAIRLQDHAGWHVRQPWVLLSVIDGRPQRVCLTSSAHAAQNCKLVEFVPSAYREFVAVEGFRFYWWSNRFSINLGYREEYRGMRDVLRGYAFSAEHYPFIRVLKEYSE